MINFGTHPLGSGDIPAVRSLCRLVFAGNIYGHLFFVWEKDQLVIYPHDDAGFGVIAPPRTEGELPGFNFLREAARIGCFEVSLTRPLPQDLSFSTEIQRLVA